MASKPDGDRLDVTVLIVDDDEHFRAALADSLEEDGYGVLGADSGEGALALLDDASRGRMPKPDLMVLDLLMPGLSGVELLQRLRNSGCWERLPVLVVTALNDPMLPVRLDVPIAFKPDAQVVLEAIRRQLTLNRAGPA